MAINELALEPGGEGLGIEAGQEAVVGEHHQPLDVVGVARGLQLVQHRVHAGHAAAAELFQPGRQGPGGLEMVEVRIGGAEPVVEAVGVFPPAQDLADHALQAGQGHAVGSG